jgi:hypothetical protein
MDVQRLSSGVYTAHLTGVRTRYEPNLPSSSEKKYQVKGSHVEKLLYCVPNDINVSDKILVDSIEFVVVRNSKYRDSFGKHDEILMRQL